MEIRDAAELSSTSASGGEEATVTPLHPLRRSDGLVAVDLWVVEPGGKISIHKHGEEHVIFVISGAMDVSSGASSSVARQNAVIYIGPGESHGLRNSGSEPARLLVSTPLLVRSERGLMTGGMSNSPSIDERSSAESMIRERPAERPASSARDEDAGRLEAPPRTAQPEEGDVPDISSLMKRGSDLAGVQRPERKRPPTPPVEVQEPAVEEDNEGEDTEDSPSNLMELFVAFEGGIRDKPPGQGFGSYMVQAPGRKPVVKHAEFGDNFTAQQSEYASLLACVKYIMERLGATGRGPGGVQLDIRSGSNTIVNQLLGTEKVKDVALRKSLDQALELLGRFADWRIEWHDKSESVRLLGGG
ncbi:MAG: cupin domain-containing protein [Chloroflexia bacterium]